MTKKQAIDGKRANLFLVQPEKLVIIGLDTDDGPEHPLYDRRINLPLDEGMTKNIMVYGVLEPVTVRKNGDEVEVVDGRQRVRHAREANRILEEEGKETVLVPVMAPRKADESTLYGISVSANENRRNDAPSVKAEKAARLLAMKAGDISAVAIAFGVTEQTVRNWLTLLDLHGRVKEAVDRGYISPTAAAKLGSLALEDQAQALDEMLSETKEGKKPTVKAAQEKAQEKKTGEANAAPGKRKMQKVVEHGKAYDIDPGVIAGLRWAIGDLDPSRIAGLKALLKDIEDGAI